MEETILFPLTKLYENKHEDNLLIKLNRNILEIESEHENAGHILNEIRKTTDDYKVPEMAATPSAWRMKD